MDDVTSGFNIGRNISIDDKFNELLGFCENEVKDMLNYYKQTGLLNLNLNVCMSIIKQLILVYKGWEMVHYEEV